MSEITPLFMYDFQRNLNVRFSNSWARVLGKLWYKQVSITQSSSSLQELYEWMLETAEIRSTGSKGTELDFEDLVAISHSITNENFGTGLKLNRNSIEDNKYDRAAKWAADAGSAASYWPQRQIVELIKNGTSKKAYDGKNFFDTGHPVNPYDDAAGTYDNLLTPTGTDITPAILASVAASIASVPQPGKTPRYLEIGALVVPPALAYGAYSSTGAEILTDPQNSNGASPATNMIKRNYAYGQPIVVPELAAANGGEDDVFYVGCEANEDAFQGAFIYQERKPFELTSYTGMTQAELDRINEFEWHLRGRNTAAYGHPYMFYRVELTPPGP